MLAEFRDLCNAPAIAILHRGRGKTIELTVRDNRTRPLFAPQLATRKNSVEFTELSRQLHDSRDFLLPAGML